MFLGCAELTSEGYLDWQEPVVSFYRNKPNAAINPFGEKLAKGCFLADLARAPFYSRNSTICAKQSDVRPSFGAVVGRIEEL